MRPFLVAVLAPALLIAASMPATAEVVIAGGGGTAGRSLTMSTNDAQFDWSIVVRRNDKGDPQDVCLDATPLVATQGGTVVAGTKLSVDAKEGVDKVCAPLGGNEQKVFKYIGSLPVEGEFKLQFGLIAADVRQSYEATITRKSPATRLSFVGATADGKIAITSDRAAFALPLMIRRTDRDPPQELPVTLRASTFTNSTGGKTITPQLMRDGQPVKSNEPLKLPPFGEALVTLVPGDGTANLADIEGQYVGEIVYEVLGARASVTLTLNRTLPDLDFKAEAISKLRGVAGEPSIGFHLHLQNSTGAPRRLYAPEIFHLDRIDAAASPPAEVVPTRYSVRVTNAKTGSADFPLTVEGNQPADLVVTLAGLNEAGAYKGVVRLAAPDRKPLDLPFELSLRLCWWYAAGAILFGVLIATLVRFLQQFAQPRLLLQADALEVRGKLDELRQSQEHNLNQRERAMITSLRDRIDHASGTLRNAFATTDAASAEVALVRARLPLLPALITARRRRDAVQPPDAGAVVDGDLDIVYATLGNDAAQPTELTAALTLLNGVDGKLRTELLKRIKQAADAMRREVDGLPTLGQIAADGVRSDLDAVDAAVAAVPAHVEEAQAALDRARESYVTALSAALRGVVAAPNPPFGFNQAQWDTFRAEVGGQLDEVLAEPRLDRRVARWNTVSFGYLARTIERAHLEIRAKLNPAPADPAVKVLWDAAQAMLGEAAKALAAHRLTAAQGNYNDALGQAQKALTANAAAPAAPAAAAAAMAAFAPAAPAGGAAPATPSSVEVAVAVLVPLPLGPGATMAGVQRALVGSTLLILALGLFVATVSGLQVLYEPNPTFGIKDLVVAFLWGAGIQAAAGQAFQGLQAVFRS